MSLSVGVLGPLELSAGGQPVAVTSSRLRTLIAVLAMSAGEVVSTDRLATALWGEDLPQHARRVIQTYLVRLRDALGSTAIITGPSGYTLRVEPEQVDALRFIGLLNDASAAADRASERARLAEALALWRGTPFDGLQSAWLEQVEAPRLVERYLAAVERRVDLDLAEGRHTALVAELGELTTQHPLRESLWARLLAVLDRCGRRAEALGRYEVIRSRLAKELGVEPGSELRGIYSELLDTRAPQPSGRVSPGPARRPAVPRQLPADLDGFTGRESSLRALTGLYGKRSAGAGSMTIAAITGTAGVGKTTLAVHWAHLVADQFPDGQLYVNLRGFHPSGPALEPGEAVRGFLSALGVLPQRIPSDLDAQAALYRSLLADRRVLVVLDNARDAHQIRPLLPGSSSCFVVVTSRNQLSGLIAAHAAHPIALDVLPVEEARELLAQRLGAERVAIDSRATDKIIARCAGLPLALSVVAARTAATTDAPLDVVAAELWESRSGLAAFTVGDPATDARAVFSWSYNTLGAGSARLFRLLGLHPGPDISVPAAASLAGLPVEQTQPLLTELARAHLVSPHLPGRYALHDLLRAYATELAHVHDTDAERRYATQRMLDYYLHTAHAGARLLDPHRDSIDVAAAQPGVAPEAPASHDAAMAWFTTELGVLLSVLEVAVATSFDAYVWQIAWTLNGYLLRQGLWHEQAIAELAAFEAAQRLDDRIAQARAKRGLASAYLELSKFGDAEACLRHALDLAGDSGDQAGQAHCHRMLGSMFEAQGRYADGLQHARLAFQLSQATGHRFGHASALNQIGWHLAHLDQPEQALTLCRQALELHQEIGNRRGEASTWDSLGYIHHQLGQQSEAITCYENARRLLSHIGDRYYEACTLNRMGDAYEAAEPEMARTSWQQALDLLEELDHPDGDEVRRKLARLGGGIPRPIRTL